MTIDEFMENYYAYLEHRMRTFGIELPELPDLTDEEMQQALDAIDAELAKLP